MSERQSSKVTTADIDGPFANITSDDGTATLFAAYADIETEGCAFLTVEQAVTYVVVDTPGGGIARNIQVQPAAS